MMTQKDDPYTYLFSTLSEVKIAVLIFLSQLNILCSSQVKQYYTKSDISTAIQHVAVYATMCSQTN